MTHLLLIVVPSGVPGLLDQHHPSVEAQRGAQEQGHRRVHRPPGQGRREDGALPNAPAQRQLPGARVRGCAGGTCRAGASGGMGRAGSIGASPLPACSFTLSFFSSFSFPIPCVLSYRTPSRPPRHTQRASCRNFFHRVLFLSAQTSQFPSPPIRPPGRPQFFWQTKNDELRLNIFGADMDHCIEAAIPGDGFKTPQQLMFYGCHGITPTPTPTPPCPAPYPLHSPMDLPPCAQAKA